MTLTEFLRVRIAEDDVRWRDHSEHDHNDYEPAPAPWPRLLAECEAKRVIVDFLNLDGMPQGEGRYVAEKVLRLLALPYADHPDYLPEWKP